MKFAIFATFLIIGSLAQANCLDVYGNLRSGDESSSGQACSGNIVTMLQPEALKACPVGSRLPTLLELANIAVASGAQRIITRDEGLEVVPNGYTWWTIQNLDGSINEFAFFSLGFDFSQSGFDYYAYWSSSVDAEDQSRLGIIDGRYGSITTLHHLQPQGPYAVRCVRN